MEEILGWPLSTKNREPLLEAELKSELFPYIAGILNNLNGKLLAGNGPDDHVHLLISLPATRAIADAIRVLKANSSGWVHEKWPAHARFVWQTGYGAFTVSFSQCRHLRQYIANQEEHHRTITFKDEFRNFLKKHQMAYDERYIWE